MLQVSISNTCIYNLLHNTEWHFYPEASMNKITNLYNKSTYTWTCLLYNVTDLLCIAPTCNQVTLKPGYMTSIITG